MGATGPQGPHGVQGITGIVQGYSTQGTAPYPSSTFGFITPTLTITIQQGQKVFLVASRALGGYFAANELGINPAYQSVEPGSPMTKITLGMYGMQVPANTRITFSVNGIGSEAELRPAHRSNQKAQHKKIENDMFFHHVLWG